MTKRAGDLSPLARISPFSKHPNHLSSSAAYQHCCKSIRLSINECGRHLTRAMFALPKERRFLEAARAIGVTETDPFHSMVILGKQRYDAGLAGEV